MLNDPINFFDPLGLFSIDETYGRYTRGEGKTLTVPFKQIDPGFNPIDFQGFRDLTVTTAPGTSVPVRFTKGIDLGEFPPNPFGRVKIILKGILTKDKCGSFSFAGDISAENEPFDFNPADWGERSFPKELATMAFDKFAPGAEFKVDFEGKRKVKIRFNAK